MKVCAITCSGQRATMLSLCQKQVMRQTRTPDLWIVNNDTDDPLTLERTPFETKATEFRWSGSFLFLLQDLLAEVPPDHAVVWIEDDDWYAADYIQTIVDSLSEKHPAAGNSMEPRYCLPARKWRIKMKHYPNCGNTALHPSAIRSYSEMLSTEKQQPWIDWWRQIRGTTNATPMQRIAMKGVGYGSMPGRRSRGPNDHDPKLLDKRWRHDPDLDRLRQWIGKDLEFYAPFTHSD